MCSAAMHGVRMWLDTRGFGTSSLALPCPPCRSRGRDGASCPPASPSAIVTERDGTPWLFPLFKPLLSPPPTALADMLSHQRHQRHRHHHRQSTPRPPRKVTKNHHFLPVNRQRLSAGWTLYSSSYSPLFQSSHLPSLLPATVTAPPPPPTDRIAYSSIQKGGRPEWKMRKLHYVAVCLALLISISTGQSDQSRRKTGIDMYFEQVKSFPPDIPPNLPVSTSLPFLVRLPPP
jgi:hypothetical protein